MSRTRTAWRWWDGERWSGVVYQAMPIEKATQRARVPFGNRDHLIEWTDYWPEGARVPRLDGEWIFHFGSPNPAGDARVEICLRSEHINEGHAPDFFWTHGHAEKLDTDCEIVAWRLAA